MLILSTFLVWATPLRQELGVRLEAYLVDWHSVAGTVITAEPAPPGWGRPDHWRYTHAFPLHDGTVVRGESYGQGDRFDTGQTVFIQYDPLHPETNHLVGLFRRHPMRVFYLALAFPVFALLFFAVGITRQWRLANLLERGILVWANIDRFEEGPAWVPGVPGFLRRRTCHLSYEYGRKVFHATWRRPVNRHGSPAEPVLVLVDGESPVSHHLYDAVSGAPPRDAAGARLPIPPGSALSLFLPAFLCWLNLLFLLLTI